jgi:two-component system, NarL family, invasion response regulator UvrY
VVGAPPRDARIVTAVSVLTVDDQAVFRSVARELVAATPGFAQVGEAASGAEALSAVATLHPQLVLLDVRMPGMDGVETARRIRSVYPDAVVVLVSADDADEETAHACGAATWVRKQELGPSRLRRLWALYGAPA